MCVTIVTNQLYETAPHNHESGLSPQFFIKNIKFIILFYIFWNFSATKNDEVIKSSLEGQPYESNVITTDLFFQQQQKRHNSLCSRSLPASRPQVTKQHCSSCNTTSVHTVELLYFYEE